MVKLKYRKQIVETTNNGCIVAERHYIEMTIKDYWVPENISSVIHVRS